MVVDFNTGGPGYIVGREAAVKRTAVPAQADSVSLKPALSLQKSSAAAAQVRPEKVAQAAALINDGSYPSDAVLNRLASFLAPRI